MHCKTKLSMIRLAVHLALISISFSAANGQAISIKKAAPAESSAELTLQEAIGSIGLAVSDSKRFAAIGSDFQEFTIVDLKTREQIRKLEGHPISGAQAAVFSNDDRHLFTAVSSITHSELITSMSMQGMLNPRQGGRRRRTTKLSSRFIGKWSLSTGELIDKSMLPEGTIVKAFASNQTYVAALLYKVFRINASGDMTKRSWSVRILDRRSGKSLRDIPLGETVTVYAATFSPKSDNVIVVTKPTKNNHSLRLTAISAASGKPQWNSDIRIGENSNPQNCQIATTENKLHILLTMDRRVTHDELISLLRDSGKGTFADQLQQQQRRRLDTANPTYVASHFGIFNQYESFVFSFDVATKRTLKIPLGFVPHHVGAEQDPLLRPELESFSQMFIKPHAGRIFAAASGTGFITSFYVKRAGWKSWLTQKSDNGRWIAQRLPNERLDVAISPDKFLAGLSTFNTRSQDRSLFATNTSANSMPKLIDARVRDSKKEKTEQRTIGVSPHGHFFASADNDHVLVQSLQTGEVITTIPRRPILAANLDPRLTPAAVPTIAFSESNEFALVAEPTYVKTEMIPAFAVNAENNLKMFSDNAPILDKGFAMDQIGLLQNSPEWTLTLVDLKKRRHKTVNGKLSGSAIAASFATNGKRSFVATLDEKGRAWITVVNVEGESLDASTKSHLVYTAPASRMDGMTGSLSKLMGSSLYFAIVKAMGRPPTSAELADFNSLLGPSIAMRVTDHDRCEVFCQLHRNTTEQITGQEMLVPSLHRISFSTNVRRPVIDKIETTRRAPNVYDIATELAQMIALTADGKQLLVAKCFDQVAFTRGKPADLGGHLLDTDTRRLTKSIHLPKSVVSRITGADVPLGFAGAGQFNPAKMLFGSMGSAKLSPSGKHIAYQFNDRANTTLIVDTVTGACVREVINADTVHFAGSDDLLILDRNIWSIKTGKRVRSLSDASAEPVVVTGRDPDIATERGWTWFTGVGSNDYTDRRFQQLQFAEPDVTATKESLYRELLPLQSRFEDRMFLGKNTAAPTIENALDDLVLSAAPEDLVVLMFAGHGVRGQRGLYLATSNSQYDTLQGTAINWGTIAESISNINAHRVVVLLDACHAGAFADTNLEIQTELQRRLEGKPGVAVFAASGGRERSVEISELEHGAFTTAVLEAIDGKADANADDELTVAEFRDYLAVRVAQITNNMQHPTTPVITLNDGDVLFEALEKPRSVATNVDRFANVDSTITNSLGATLQFIAPGEFMMGSKDSPYSIETQFPFEDSSHFSERNRWEHEDQYPEHRVRLTKPFYMGRHEVTNREFSQFVAETGYVTDRERNAGPSRHPLLEVSSRPDATWKSPGYKTSPDYPVTFVSWNDAKRFCAWLGEKEGKVVRLPTQAEWEYACRAGTTSRYWNGNDPEELAKVANIPNRPRGTNIRIKIKDGKNDFWAMQQVHERTRVATITKMLEFEFEKRTDKDPAESDFELRNKTDRDLTLEHAGKQFVLRKDQSIRLAHLRELAGRVGLMKYELNADRGSPKSIPLRSRAGSIIHITGGENPVVFQRYYYADYVEQNAVYVVNNTTRAIATSAGSYTTIPPGEGRKVDLIDLKKSLEVDAHDGFEGIAPVGQFPENPFGLHDMLGNVWEWCDDPYYQYESSPRFEYWDDLVTTDPKGSDSNRYVFRGGCFL